MTPQDAINALRNHAVEGKALQMAAYHKSARPFLGVANPMIDAEVKQWRGDLDIDGRIQLADGLWKSNIHEARIAATKLLTQARIRPDDAVWELIKSWVPDFDAWAIADHACTAGRKRLEADPDRIEEVELWTKSPHMWTRRAALVITLPWTKQNHPKAQDMEIRDRVLGWAAGYVDDKNWFIQKSISWWLRDLSKHDPDRTRAFLATYGARMKPFARKDAAKNL
ncbi:DNA alkylation repair protein [Profundibacter sp.]